MKVTSSTKIVNTVMLARTITTVIYLHVFLGENLKADSSTGITECFLLYGLESIRIMFPDIQ